MGVVLKIYTFFYKRRSKRCILGVNARDMLGLEAWSRPGSQFSATMASASDPSASIWTRQRERPMKTF